MRNVKNEWRNKDVEEREMGGGGGGCNVMRDRFYPYAFLH